MAFIPCTLVFKVNIHIKHTNILYMLFVRDIVNILRIDKSH